ncbi:MAG: UvrB/UvrC motif-containing protein [Arachnia sp.]
MDEYRNSDGRSSGTRRASVPVDELSSLIDGLTSQMHQAAAALQFEVAARHRDEIADLKKELRQMIEATK